MVGVYQGSTEIVPGKLPVGTTPIKRVFQGSNRIWPKWNPTLIFAGPSRPQGCYYEMGIGMTSLGFHRLYQDTARTNPVTAVGQNVKSISDLSGNGRHIPALALNCTLQYDATGGYFLQKPSSASSANLFQLTGLNDVQTAFDNFAITIGYSPGPVCSAASYVAQYGLFPTGHFENLATNANSLGDGVVQFVGPSGVPNLGPAESIGSNVNARTYVWRNSITGGTLSYAAYRNGIANVIFSGTAAAGTVANSTTISIGSSGVILRNMLCLSGVPLSDADFAAFDNYSRNIPVGSQPI